MLQTMYIIIPRRDRSLSPLGLHYVNEKTVLYAHVKAKAKRTDE
jgi:hypothetical protein